MRSILALLLLFSLYGITKPAPAHAGLTVAYEQPSNTEGSQPDPSNPSFLQSYRNSMGNFYCAAGNMATLAVARAVNTANAHDNPLEALGPFWQDSWEMQARIVFWLGYWTAPGP